MRSKDSASMNDARRWPRGLCKVHRSLEARRGLDALKLVVEIKELDAVIAIAKAEMEGSASRTTWFGSHRGLPVKPSQIFSQGNRFWKLTILLLQRILEKSKHLRYLFITCFFLKSFSIRGKNSAAVLKPCKHPRGSTGYKANKILHKFRALEDRMCMLSHGLSTSTLRHNAWSPKLLHKIIVPVRAIPNVHNIVTCQVGQPKDAVLLSIKTCAVLLTRVYNSLQESPLILQCAPAVGLMVFAAWGVGPFLQLIRHVVFRRNAGNWKKSKTYYFMASYLRPIFLWVGAMLICRAFDPVVASSETNQAIKQRLLNFVRSLSTVLAFAYCTSCMLQQVQKSAMEHQNTLETRNLGFEFTTNALYTAVGVAVLALFVQLLGSSIQKGIFAGGFGTVLLTLVGREIFSNYMSSIMLHITRPFVANEWIKTKIDGYEVSGTVEHVGWWSPTIVRGDDREAVHIPNRKFTVTVVRNISQKTHWCIKTHLAISHLDVNKVRNIMADMRKVLAKNPHIEQQRLPRRVFLEEVNEDSQALMILVSCFVKTTHFEEYLCVKEAVLLDLLRVISHHRARLATPIRSLYKMHNDNEAQSVPFQENMAGRGAGVPDNRRFLLIESRTLNGEDEGKQQSLRSNQELNTSHTKVVASEAKDIEAGTILSKDTFKNDTSDAKGDHKQKEMDPVANDLKSKSSKQSSEVVETLPPKLHPEGLNSMGLNSNDKTLHGAASGKQASKDGKNGIKSSSEVHCSVTEIKRVKPDSTSRLDDELISDKGKQQGQGSSLPSPKSVRSTTSTSRLPLEENMPLGVALNGPKINSSN
ncbi:hypothetical protein SUGI_0247020 [Cryptomeria japonica]|nr:hypothetical protein SUGI_0247020 [Cryptomeria japonica]